MNTFINDFKNSIYFNEIIHKFDNTVLAYIGGSRCHNLNTQYSDYDITILVDEDINRIDSVKYHYLSYKGRKVHWYYVPLSQLFLSHSRSIYDLLSATTLCGIITNKHYDLVIYENEYYKNIIKYLFVHSLEVEVPLNVRAGMCYKESLYKYVNGSKNISDNNCRSAKFLYFCCLISHKVLSTDVNINMLKELKLAKRTHNMSPECLNYALTQLKNLTLFLDNYTENFSEVLEQAQLDLNTEIKRLHNNV